MGDFYYEEEKPELPYRKLIRDGPMQQRKAITVTLNIPHNDTSTGFFIALTPEENMKPETTLRILVQFDGLHAKSLELNYMDDNKWHWPPKTVDAVKAGDLIQRGKTISIKISAPERDDRSQRLKVYVGTELLDVDVKMHTELNKIRYLHIRGLGQTKLTVASIKTERYAA